MKKLLIILLLPFLSFAQQPDPYIELGVIEGVYTGRPVIFDDYLIIHGIGSDYDNDFDGLVNIYDTSTDNLVLHSTKDFLRMYPDQPGSGSNWASASYLTANGIDEILISGSIYSSNTNGFSALRKYNSNPTPQIEKICKSCSI